VPEQAVVVPEPDPLPRFAADICSTGFCARQLLGIAGLLVHFDAVISAGDRLDPREPSEYVSKLIVACVRLAPPSDD
jgi:hypothetical protein